MNIIRGLQIPFVPQIVDFSVIKWFNDTYFGRGGMGFSLVGEGYVNY